MRAFLVGLFFVVIIFGPGLFFIRRLSVRETKDDEDHQLEVSA